MVIDVSEAEQIFNTTEDSGSTNKTILSSNNFEDFISDPKDFIGNVVNSDTTKQAINNNLIAVAKNRTQTADNEALKLTAEYDPVVTNLEFDETATFTTFCENNCADHELLVLPVNNA